MRYYAAIGIPGTESVEGERWSRDTYVSYFDSDAEGFDAIRDDAAKALKKKGCPSFEELSERTIFTVSPSRVKEGRRYIRSLDGAESWYI